MVVSAIVLAALAPVTGALFGAAYGTSIRIGYEIIFPALFLGKEKTGAKDVVKALTDMYTLTGGLDAHKFGIQQGLELAKKNAESPEGQSLVSLAIGLPTSLTAKESGLSGSSLKIPPSGLVVPDTTGGTAQRHQKLKDHYDEIAYQKTLITTVQIKVLGEFIYDNWPYQEIRLAYTIAKSKSALNEKVWAQQSKAKPNPFWKFSTGEYKIMPTLMVKGIIYAWKKAGAEKDWQTKKAAKDKEVLTLFGKKIKASKGSASIKITEGVLTKTFLKSKIVIINSKIVLELNIIKNLKISLAKKYTQKIAELIKVHQNLLKDLKKKLQDIATLLKNPSLAP